MCCLAETRWERTHGTAHTCDRTIKRFRGKLNTDRCQNDSIVSISTQETCHSTHRNGHILKLNFALLGALYTFECGFNHTTSSVPLQSKRRTQNATHNWNVSNYYYYHWYNRVAGSRWAADRTDWNRIATDFDVQNTEISSHSNQNLISVRKKAVDAFVWSKLQSTRRHHMDASELNARVRCRQIPSVCMWTLNTAREKKTIYRNRKLEKNAIFS